MNAMSQRTALAIFVLTAISLGTWVNGLFPAAVLTKPYEYTGTHAPTLGTVEVTGTRTADTWNGVGTQGTYLMVDAQVSDIPKVESLDATLIDAAGRSNASMGTGCGVHQPGLPAPCTFTFEVDPTQLAGAHLRVRNAMTEMSGAVLILPLEASK